MLLVSEALLLLHDLCTKQGLHDEVLPPVPRQSPLLAIRINLGLANGRQLSNVYGKMPERRESQKLRRKTDSVAYRSASTLCSRHGRLHDGRLVTQGQDIPVHDFELLVQPFCLGTVVHKLL